MTNPPITRAQVDAALLLLEHADIPAANLVRNYIAGLEGRLRVAELEAVIKELTSTSTKQPVKV